MTPRGLCSAVLDSFRRRALAQPSRRETFENKYDVTAGTALMEGAVALMLVINGKQWRHRPPTRTTRATRIGRRSGELMHVNWGCARPRFVVVSPWPSHPRHG